VCGFPRHDPKQCRTYRRLAERLFNQKMGYTTVDLKAYERNVENVTKWSGSNPKETLMSGLQRATSPK
jgi:hypothetical protein